MLRSLMWLFMYVAAAATASTTAAIFEVTATAICCDSNSLEYAVQNAKAGDTIRINIDSSSGYIDPEYPWAYTIQLTSAHTQIILKAPRVVLDGLHQSTAGLNRTGAEDARPAVLLRGAPNNTDASLVVVQPEATGVVIRGIGSVKGVRGLRIQARDVQVESGYFCNHQRVGIYVDREEAAGSVIGSNQPNSRPVIVSGNQKQGIYAHGANTTIRGVLAMGNTGTGIYIGGGAVGTVVGSEAVNVTTLVSNNGVNGISVNAENCSIRGVLVGTDITGKHARGNKKSGIYIGGGQHTVIGSEMEGVLTLISGNNGYGILACSSSTSIRGVLIGTDVTGVAALGNGYDGIQLCPHNDGSVVGSFIPSVKTVLSGNRRNGLYLGGGAQTKLIGVYAGVGKDGITTVANSHHGILALPVTQFVKCAGTKGCSTIIGSIGAPPSVFSGNGGHGIDSRTQSLDMVGTIYAGIGLDGLTPIPNGLDGVHIAGTGDSTTIASGLVASGNHGRGLYIGAHSVFVENAYIGVDATGTAMVGNGGDGLFISESATSDVWVIGGIASGNGRSGVVVEGQGVHLDGMMVGLSTNGVSPLGNGRYGIEVGDYGTHFQVGAMVVPGFLLHPFRTCRFRNEICAASQLPCSNAKERDACAVLCMLETACVSFEWDTTSHTCQLSTSCTMLTSGRFILGETWELWVRNRGELTRPTVISGNTLGGIIAAAQQMWLCNIQIGGSAEIGTTVAGSTRMNSGTGVTILPSATSALVGTNSAFNATQCTPIIKAHSEYGIHGAAPNLRIVSASIMGNNRDGIYLETRATNADIIASTIDQNGAANDGAGIRTRAQDTAIYNCTVGQSISRYYESQTNLGATSAGNKGVGVHIEAGATGTAIAGSTYIAGNGLVGIRDDTVSTESSNTYIDESTTHTDTNGWAQDACILCKCLPDSNMLTVVDCRPAAAGMDVRDFGPSFPTNLPTTLSELRISNVNLHTIEWDEVYAAGARLKVFDVANNPLLNPLPPAYISGKVASSPFNGTLLPALQVLGLSGTNLAAMQNNTFSKLNRKLVTTVDVSSPVRPGGTPRAEVEVDFTGFSAPLAAVKWYDNNWCPPGFYATTTLPAQNDAATCVRCPFGTFKPGSGGFVDSCTKCSSSTVDDDVDPTTPCILRDVFAVTSFKHYHPEGQNHSSYIFSTFNDVSKDNDPCHPPAVTTGHCTRALSTQPYFGIRSVSDIDTSFQTIYVDVPVNIPPLKVITLTHNSSAAFIFTMEDAPPGFFIKPDSGEIMARPRFQNNTNSIEIYSTTMYAVDGSGAKARLETIHFTVIQQDIKVPTNGPNNQDCVHGDRVDGSMFDGQFTCDCSNTPYAGSTCSESGPNSQTCFNGGRVVDTILYDGEYTCDCATGFSGDNCGTDLVVAAAQQKAVVIYAVGIIMFVLVVGMIVYVCCKRKSASKDALLALNEARKAYGLQVISKVPRNHARGNVFTNPTFIGITLDDNENGEDHASSADEFNVVSSALVNGTTDGPNTANTSPEQTQQLESKFVAPVMRLGENTLATKGLDVLLGVDPRTYMHVKDKVKVIINEFAKHGTAEDNRNLKGLIDGTYVNPGSDRDARVRSIDEIMSAAEVGTAGLQVHHVLAVRLYTTSTFKSINHPMRQSPPVLPHPFAATLYYISDALSKLREVQGKNPEKRNANLTFWRGMKNLQITEEFIRTGGTEMGCMSTTSSRDVAKDFAASDCPLLFKFMSRSFMSHGADISFLSVYPEEREVLYPPLTFLRPIKLSQETIDGKIYQIAEVEPVFPK